MRSDGPNILFDSLLLLVKSQASLSFLKKVHKNVIKRHKYSVKSQRLQVTANPSTFRSAPGYYRRD